MAKLSFFLMALFVVSTAMEQKLLPLKSGLGTCLRYCNTNADCDDCWLCCDCVPSAFEGSRAQCDKSTVNGEGYFGTILKNQRRLKNIINAA
ncbi:unnamed protein product [Withania somnifera]